MDKITKYDSLVPQSHSKITLTLAGNDSSGMQIYVFVEKETFDKNEWRINVEIYKLGTKRLDCNQIYGHVADQN